MPVFVWKGRTLAGESQSGEIEVGRQEEVVDVLRKRKILVTSVRPKAGGFALPKFGGSPASTKDLAIFTRQFATMISAGLPLVQCLDILAKQSSKPSFGRVISDVTREVESGSTLSDALGKHKPVFDDLFRNMVAARDLHREGRRAQAQDPERDGLSGGRADRGARGDLLHADLHHPDVRQDVH